MKTTYTIAVTAPFWMEYASELLKGAQAYAREQTNMRVIALPIHEHGQSPISSKGTHFDGLFAFANVKDQQWIETLWKNGLPVVNSSGDIQDSDIPMIRPEPIYLKAAEYLKKLGRQDVAFVCPDLQKHPAWKPLCDGFRLDVPTLGLNSHIFSQCEVDPGYAPSRIFEAHLETELIAFLKKLPKPAGVWCPNDELAALVCECARISGLSVPQDIAVIGTGNSQISRLSTPSISSFKLPAQTIGYEGMRLLHQLILEKYPPKEPIHISIPVPPIIERESTITQAPDRTLTLAREFILNHASDGITIKDVLAQIPMSRMTFYNLYKASFGCTPAEDLRRSRLESAKNLLASSSMNITEVASACGFNEPNKFYVFFKRETTLSPSQWRDENNKTHP
ncbi:substrate-binding domain-containing protein [Rubritalea tangerina]|uniref:Substrate-binding domain-containing protein n=1 Tax=Rubritalea tangerina TaxID=430798 RepID=A0ABW4ZBD6_9BACT